MTSLPLAEWIEGLAAQLDMDADQSIGAFLGSYRIRAESVRPWLLLDSNRYTRSLLLDSARWQCVLMCWNSGQRTPVHDHNGLPAWATLVIGSLGVRDFVVAPARPDRSIFQVEESGSVTLDGGAIDCPAHAEAGVHEVRNASASSQCAVSVHIYRQPMKCCGTYDPATGRYQRVPLSFDRNLTAQFAHAVGGGAAQAVAG
jgi:cysteine dioxygenase